MNDVNNLFSLAGQVALITGSTQGLGYQIAQGLGKAGARIIVHSRNESKARETAQTLINTGFDAGWVCFDINDQKKCEAVFSDIKQQYGRLDILVNNASIRNRKTLSDMSHLELEEIVQTNIVANIRISRHAIELMKTHHYGRIVTISSIAGQLIRFGDFAYPITKQALNTMTRAIAVEFGRDGIISNAIAPGTFATEFNEKLTQETRNIAKMQERNPLQRWGNPMEIIGPALFLSSPAASYVNGQTLAVDGGFSITF